ncbi:FxDxF family PEP-CTERM protein [Rhizobacter sp. LjRoot28]|jgi:hypothetical protein|uniref:FxDxF family PEP-CTERM protein n=1 Tax=Rhizobacter sp. LjRoot28 TaxID=3342309 RepID=UPI003ED019F6
MSRKKLFPKRLVAAMMAAAGISAAVPAQADTFALGVISASQTIDIFNDGLSGWFYDKYTFTVAEGSSLNLTGAVSNVFGQDVSGASNLWSDLYVGAGQFVRFAVASTSPVDGSDGLFEKTASYNGLRLGAGTYGLLVQGLVQGSAPAPTSSYTGQLRFDVAAPVPEPAAWALMAVGLVGIGAAARKRRSAGSAAA